VVVAALDRMGLRPLRLQVTHDGFVFVGTEAGASAFPSDSIKKSAQLDPGEMVEIDLEKQCLRTTRELREKIIAETAIAKDVPSARDVVPIGGAHRQLDPRRRERLLACFGWSSEERKGLRHLAKEGKEPITSMGWDRPIAILDPRPLPIYDYFHQTIAVVTNPPIDPIREGGAIDLSVHLGPRPPIFGKDGAEPPSALLIEHPVLTNNIAPQVRSGIPGKLLVRVVTVNIAASSSPREMERALDDQIDACIRAIESRQANVLWFSDRGAWEDGLVPLPLLLVIGGVHHGLIQRGLRRHASLVAEAGDVGEGHDLAVLLAHGADAVNPYLLFEEVEELAGAMPDAIANVERSLTSSLKRIMSKMGITSIEGYVGSQLFEAVGISDEVIDRYLPGTSSRIGGLDLADIHRATLERSERTDDGERNAPETVPVYRKAVTNALQEVARSDDPGAYARYIELVRETPPTYLRDLLEFKLCRSPLLLDEVEPAEAIVRACFRGAAMSHGALNSEAHRAIALAFNRIGSSSNAGEGGEDERRNRGGPWEEHRSRIRQVASARFGVDAEYLVNADEIEIKIGQGAKPGEGGHLPGYKVTAEIARIRRTREGVTLISPPPHHDIYSIEDLAQLIDSLRQVHPDARIGVKTPATVELGTILTGVAKAGADVISISGFEGGTGAASKSSIEHAGLPLERGLTEAHRALGAQGIRDRLILRADGGIKTGLDVAKLLALGADEVAFGTALMVAEQCIMCRGCSFGKCPTGITTQDPHYKKRFLAKVISRAPGVDEQSPLDDAEAEARIFQAADGIERVLVSIAGEVREILAALGLRTVRDLIGRADLLMQIRTKSRKTASIDLSAFLEGATTTTTTRSGAPLRPREVYPLNRTLVEASAASFEDPTKAIDARFRIENTDRSVGATAAGKLAAIYQRERFERGGYVRRHIRFRFSGCAGQGFGFALVDGMTLELDGYANDTCGAAMSAGSMIIVRPPPSDQGGAPHLVGNTACYGATGGSMFIGGRAGQRLGVRSSGATIVAEGAGKYAFEYMTDGIGVLLSESGPVIGSGLTGGTLYLLDERGDANRRVHQDTALVPLDAEDRALLREVLERFVDATGSALGARILEAFELSVRRFVKGVARDLVRPSEDRPKPQHHNLAETPLPGYAAEAEAAMGGVPVTTLVKT
jgi:glutamate synthase domain-containing protein 2/glutamate synthase domain-containing protein 3